MSISNQAIGITTQHSSPAKLVAKSPIAGQKSATEKINFALDKIDESTSLESAFEQILFEQYKNSDSHTKLLQTSIADHYATIKQQNKERQEQLQKRLEDLQKSGFFDFIGKIFSAIFSVATSVVGGPTGILAGGLILGGLLSKDTTLKTVLSAAGSLLSLTALSPDQLAQVSKSSLTVLEKLQQSTQDFLAKLSQAQIAGDEASLQEIKTALQTSYENLRSEIGNLKLATATQRQIFNDLTQMEYHL